MGVEKPEVMWPQSCGNGTSPTAESWMGLRARYTPNTILTCRAAGRDWSPPQWERAVKLATEAFAFVSNRKRQDGAALNKREFRGQLPYGVIFSRAPNAVFNYLSVKMIP